MVGHLLVCQEYFMRQYGEVYGQAGVQYHLKLLYRFVTMLFSNIVIVLGILSCSIGLLLESNLKTCDEQ